MRAVMMGMLWMVAAPAMAVGVDVTGACPGPALVRISGVRPGGTVAILKGRGPGGDVMPAGPCAGHATSLAGLSFITTVRDSDGDGLISLSPSLPAAVCGQFIQVLDTASCELSPLEMLGGSDEYVLFVTDTTIGSDPASWLENRLEANAHCANYAATNGIAGSDFRIVYSTPSEDARDFLGGWDPSARTVDRYGVEIDSMDLFDGSPIRLPDMKSYTITSTEADGSFFECSGDYPAGSWPICQYCSQKFACGSSGDNPFAPSACCWTGTRAVVCMGAR